MEEYLCAARAWHHRGLTKLSTLEASWLFRALYAAIRISILRPPAGWPYHRGRRRISKRSSNWSGGDLIERSTARRSITAHWLGRSKPPGPVRLAFSTTTRLRPVSEA